MKITYILLALLMSLLTACVPNLDLNPLGSQSVGSYYKTASDAEAATLSMYGQLRAMYRDEIVVTPNVIAADDGIPFLTGNADRVAMWRYGLIPTNTFVGNIWSNAYTGVQRSNVVINRIPAIPMDEATKKSYVGEAKFLRALHYFTLVRFFGGVPLVTTETNSLEDVNAARTSVDEVYKLIESDLKEAESVLPKNYTGNNVGRATAGAAKGLLAKVYLTWAGANASSPYWAQAAAKAKEVMDMGGYDLWANYADVFDLKNRGGKESIFEVMYITDLAGNNFTTGYAPRGAPIVPSTGSGIFRVSKSLFDSYAAEDKRKAVSFLTSYVNPTTKATVALSTDDTDPAKAISFWKLADVSATVSGGGGKSFIVQRFSDILLIYAEALSEANNGPTADAYTAINRVRARAGLQPLSGLSRQQFKDAILLERRLEFAFEANRWFDLVRTGRLLEAVNAETSYGRSPAIKATNLVFPIPQREMDANAALKQNDGY
ncbi:RagB/SusD family nutrient uptake outer membrane protein [Spirosoma migulaei]